MGGNAQHTGSVCHSPGVYSGSPLSLKEMSPPSRGEAEGGAEEADPTRTPSRSAASSELPSHVVPSTVSIVEIADAVLLQAISRQADDPNGVAMWALPPAPL